MTKIDASAGLDATAARPRRRRPLAFLLPVAAVFGLAACNPFTVKGDQPGMLLGVRYDGTVDAGLQIHLSGVEGYDVEFKTGMLWAGGPIRICGNGITGAIEACWVGGDWIGPHDWHASSGDAPGTYWPMMVLHPGERVSVFVHCAQQGSRATCPASLTVHARAVDAAGRIVGDLS